MPFLDHEPSALELSLMPHILYWLASAFYGVLQHVYLKYDHTKFNTLVPSFLSVTFYVLLQQFLQVVLSVVWGQIDVRNVPLFSPLLLDSSDPNAQLASWASLFFRLFIGMVVIDSYQFWAHRYMHVNSWWYKNVHSWHHRYTIPLPFAALYNHPVVRTC